ncbi:CO/xanthine dehydrogenase FAD-binding subunit [Williamsia limnetica]|jgi:CO/xanthine dehydrogenase FAD-binding subunit|uniref:CO/xanthine dehydrogenase FAD-binding subunit n=1 Tax=Williamsia limnetica TaxID=882452 RepID=A0A318RKV2_WILLI|nr:FAD binding domain-containing protein [Williamsia limnetica]PYE14709.1 CO/xanthine dehydrogenase FAD-binding subunit [Williamsia limnetica]
MDLHTIDSVEMPRTRADLAGLCATDGVMAGGTWLMSEPQLHLRRIIDLSAMDWPALTITEAGLEIAATCSISTLLAATYPPEWAAVGVFRQAAQALLASFKIWQNATIGGNICLGFPAGAMISMASALDAELLVWKADGTDLRCSTNEFVTGIARTILRPGDVLRSIRLPAAALRQPATLRKIAMSPLGRSGAVVIGRATPTGIVVSVTAATDVPYVIATDSDDPADVVAQVYSSIPAHAYYSDPHGEAGWRRQVTGVLTRAVVVELTGSGRMEGGRS